MFLTLLRPSTNYDYIYSSGSEDAAVALAFTLAMLSQLLQCCITNIEKAKNTEVNGSYGDKTALRMATTPLTNGFSEPLKGNKVGSCEEDHTKLAKAKRMTKALKQRRRRRRRRHADSFESECTSTSDLGITDSDDEDEEDNDSDLSEGGIVDGMIEDLISDDDDESEDVYVESDSENESDTHSAAPRSIFSLSRNAIAKSKTAMTEAEKLLNLPAHGQSSKLGVPLFKQNGLVLGRMMAETPSDISDAETGEPDRSLSVVYAN